MDGKSIVTLTLGDQAENHAGMQKLGELVDAGQGFHLEDLQMMKSKLEEIGCVCKIVALELCMNLHSIDTNNEMPEDAYVLIVKDGVNRILRSCSDFGLYDMFDEHLELDHDKKAWMKGKVVNKHARWNLCFDEVPQAPNYEEKKGRIVSYDEIPVTKMLMGQIPRYFGSKAENLKGEGNYYYDKLKCGIGFHGDSERRKVIGIRLGVGETPPLHFQWFINSEPVGERIILNLNAGDMYVMSEKAVGQDWKKKKIYTLRHATGCKKFTSIEKDV